MKTNTFLLGLLMLAAMFVFSNSAFAQFSGGVELGMRIGGGGNQEVKVKAEGLGSDDTDWDYDDKSGFALSAHGMFHLTENLLLGGRVFYLTKFVTEADGADEEYEWGSEADARARIDFALAVAEGAAVHFVGEAGVMMLFPGDDFKDELDEFDLDTDPRFGLIGGLGAGFTYRISDGLRLRADLMLDKYWLTVVDESVTSGGYDVDIEQKANGTRWWLLAGVEF